MMARNIVVLTLCLLLAVSCFCNGLEEADFKKMKMRELRQFLSARGLACPGCQEKSDFVRVAFSNKDVKPSGSAEKREIPPGKFWEVWSANAREACKQGVVKRGNDATTEPYASICDTVGNAVDSFLMQHSKKIASRLQKTPDHMLKTSYKHVYHDAGMRLLSSLSDYCLNQHNKCESLTFVTSVLDDGSVLDLKKWATNVGIENTNPMYEILDDRADL